MNKQDRLNKKEGLETKLDNAEAVSKQKILTLDNYFECFECECIKNLTLPINLCLIWELISIQIDSIKFCWKRKVHI